MSFKDIEIKQEYRSFQDDIVGDFFCPLLKQSEKYERAVGFFSSTALIEIVNGISGLVRNNGKIELVASPKLSEEDVVAIEKGIEEREKLIEKRINEEIFEPKNEYEEKRLDLLINLIANDILEIKIAVIDNGNKVGMYHEKMGLLYDTDNNIVAFSGSMNESTTAFTHNMEAIDVFKSWESESEKNRVETKRKTFCAMWNDYEPYMKVMDFPEVSKKKLFQYRKSDSINWGLDDEYERGSDNTELQEEKNEPAFPEGFHIREYQKCAIEKWKQNNFIGIFDMATGTGKTLTGLSAIIELYESRKRPLAIFIVCPYQHLVTQWVEDIIIFGMKPVICHSASPQKKWETRLKDECFELELGIKEHMCAVFTNATYSSKKIQNIIENIKGQAVLVIDEAHNFGATKLSTCLDEKIPYRLALSATLKRHGDDIGTKKLFDYFGQKCIEYSLKEAIEKGVLVRYYYHPILVTFEEDELENYLDLTKKIGKSIMVSKNGDINETAKRLLIKRARIVAAARQKVDALLEEMRHHQDDNHMLVYCGATTMKDADYNEGEPTDEEKRQIDIVMKRLGNELNMKVNKFTSEENSEKREILKREFNEGNGLQVLVAIRCLDEGVNIPSIKKAFILASSTNPKEYIQRRGRVLRKYKGKTHADIYDFIMTPLPINSVQGYSDEVVNLSKSLVKREIERIKDFAELAENSSVADGIIYELIDQYDIDLEDNYEEVEEAIYE